MTPTEPIQPASLRPYVDEVGDVLNKVASGNATRADLDAAVDAAFRAAVADAQEGEGAAWPTGPWSTTFTDEAGKHLSALRREAGWSQDQLAGAMRRLGFSRWKRPTVAEIESNDSERRRRLSYEELVALAALFAVPAVEFLLPEDDLIVDLGTTGAPSHVVRELLLGSGGRVGTGGPEWEAAARVARPPQRGEPPRPAVDLWRNRSASNRNTGGV